VLGLPANPMLLVISCELSGKTTEIAKALLRRQLGAQSRDCVDFCQSKSLTSVELPPLRTLALRISILSALFLTTLQAIQSVQAQDAVQPTVTAIPTQQTAPGASYQATETPTDSSIVQLNGREVAETPRRFHYTLQLAVRGVYDDNINLSQTNKTSDFYTSIEPTISLGLGGTGEDQTNFLAFVYAPNVYIFANHSNADAFQHVIHLAGQRQFAKLTLNAGEDIQILDSTNLTSLTDTTGRQANIDVGQKTRVNIFNTNVGGSYDLSSKTFLSGNAQYQVYDYPSSSLISSETVSGSLFFNYNYGAKIVVGVGGTGGYDKAEASTPDQYFEQGNLRLSYQATGKISFSATGGIEVREFSNNARGDYISPVYDLNATYQPFDGTTVSLTGSRTTRNSAVISGGDFTSTKIDLGLRQRLLQRFSLALNGGYENDDYFSAGNGVDVSRTDNYYYFQSSIDANVTRFWTIGGYYLHRQDNSSLDNFKFSDNQVGGRTSLSF